MIFFIHKERSDWFYNVNESQNVICYFQIEL